jgi:L-seryl-tRNA(Ser) seleniumtransferase
MARARDGGALNQLTAALRSLPIPVIGRIVDNGLLLDMRCLEDEEMFLSVINALDIDALS